MAVYKIFPEKSATIYSFTPLKNTGLDEILELSTFESAISSNEVSRILIKFPTDQINDIIANKVKNNDFDAYLKLYLSNASSLPIDYTIQCNPVSGSWEKGIGRLSNVPETEEGVNWTFRSQNDNVWFTNFFPTNTTGSYKLGSNVGGGLWYTGSYEATQSFTSTTSKDIELKISYTVDKWYSSSISNEGLIIKHSSQNEFSNNSKFELKYFSSNTHTIYPPCLEIRWDDFSYDIGSLPLVTSDKIVASISNNKEKYQQDSIQRFQVDVRDKYPVRSFQTSSVYLNNKVLPTSSYWSIKDLDTEEIIVDYDTTYTKISANQNGNYFDIYMNGLEPERYYKILIKTIIDGNTIVLDDNYYFKVIR